MPDLFIFIKPQRAPSALKLGRNEQLYSMQVSKLDDRVTKSKTWASNLSKYQEPNITCHINGMLTAQPYKFYALPYKCYALPAYLLAADLGVLMYLRTYPS